MPNEQSGNGLIKMNDNNLHNHFKVKKFSGVTTNEFMIENNY